MVFRKKQGVSSVNIRGVLHLVFEAGSLTELGSFISSGLPGKPTGSVPQHWSHRRDLLTQFFVGPELRVRVFTLPQQACYHWVIPPPTGALSYRNESDSFLVPCATRDKSLGNRDSGINNVTTTQWRQGSVEHEGSKDLLVGHPHPSLIQSLACQAIN